MTRLWLINQFANTPSLPGHTRQFEVAAGLVSNGWQVEVYASDFNLTQRKYRRLRFPRLWSTEHPAGISWTWLWVSSYSHNNWKRQLNMLSFCLHLALRLGPAALLGRFIGHAPDVILASSPQLPAAFTCSWIARLSGIPFVLEVRDLWPQVLIDQGGKSPHSLMVRLLAWMERQLYRNASTVVVLAKGAEPFVRERGARRTAAEASAKDSESVTISGQFGAGSGFVAGSRPPGVPAARRVLKSSTSSGLWVRQPAPPVDEKLREVNS